MEFLQSCWITCVIVSLFYWDKLTLCARRGNDSRRKCQLEKFQRRSYINNLLHETSCNLNTCPKVKIPNGSARVKSKGMLIQFRCNTNFELVGVKFAVCQPAGLWSQETPSCVGTTCQQPAEQKHLIVESLYKGGVLKFTCDAGLARSGPETIMCDGKKWTSKPPKCIEAVTLDCDFENVNLCGWNQDTNDDFDWTRNRGETPTANTGPRFDHTTNSSEGHYLFMESSAPQKTGQKTRLISPPYVPRNMATLCLEFFYHMFGPEGIGEVGNLDVYVGPQSMNTTSLTSANIFHRSGNQGDQWIRAEVQIPQQSNAFIIVLQGTRLQTWSGDISIDDIKVYQCSEKLTTSSGSVSADATTRSSTPQKTIYRPKSSTTIALPVTAIRKTKLPKLTIGSGATITPTKHITSTAATFTQARQASKTMFTATSSKRSARKTTSSDNTVYRDTSTASMFTLESPEQGRTLAPLTNKTTATASTFSSNITSGNQLDNDYVKYTTSTKIYDGGNNEKDRYNYFKQTTDAKTGLFTNSDYIEYDFNKINSHSSSSKNESVGKNESKTPFTDYDEASSSSPEEYYGLPDDMEARGNLSSPGSIALLPLIVGIVASVVVGVVVTVIMVYIWVRNQREKQDKHQEDQMNIMSDYIETNLCT